VYHDFVADEDARARVSPAHRPYVLTRARFAEHLDGLAAAGGQACALSDARSAASDRRFVLSIDDGSASDFSVAFPMLQERGWTGCFFIIAGQVGASGYVGWPELRAMADGGMEIGSHSLTHPHMQQLALRDIEREFRESKQMLEDGIGRPVTVASLPRGTAPPEIGAVLADCGYDMFCTSEPGLCDERTDPYRVPRIAVKSGTTTVFMQRVLQGRAATMASLKCAYLLKAVGKEVIGMERWRRVRGAIIGSASRRRASATTRDS